MGDRGCFSYIFGGALKGIIIGGLLGALGGVAMRQNGPGIIAMASQGAQVLGVAKLVVGALIYTWATAFSDCGGLMQSPIDIQTIDLRKRKTRKPLKWYNYSNPPKTMVMENSKHSIHANFIWDNSSLIPYITNGPLQNRYFISQFHFHWGKDSTRGSEHTVNGKRFPLEMHLVHDRRTDDSADSLKDDSVQLVVVAFVFQVNRRDNPALKILLERVKDVQGSTKKKTFVDPFPLDNLVNLFNEDYVTYKGSLTTPPCSEGVVWIISSKALPISENQLSIFRNSVKDSKNNNIQNFRETQNLNGRSVFYVQS